MTAQVSSLPQGNDPTPEQYAAIAQLTAAYCWCVDAPDEAGLVGIFAPDAVFALGRQEITGRDDVVSFLSSSVRGTHVSGPPCVRVTGSTATGRSRFVFVAKGTMLSGGYEDEYVHAEGRWLFARRRAKVTSASS